MCKSSQRKRHGRGANLGALGQRAVGHLFGKLLGPRRGATALQHLLAPTDRGVLAREFGELRVNVLYARYGSREGIIHLPTRIVEHANGPAVLTTIGAVPLAGGTMTGALVLNADPAVALGAATKQYVDSISAGLDVKPSVLCATTANITLSGEQTLDGILTSASRVLVKNQSTASQNGLYVSAGGAWARAADMDVWAEVPGAFVFVERGTLYADTAWVCTADQGGTIGSISYMKAMREGRRGEPERAGLGITALLSDSGSIDKLALSIDRAALGIDKVALLTIENREDLKDAVGRAFKLGNDLVDEIRHLRRAIEDCK